MMRRITLILTGLVLSLCLSAQGQTVDSGSTGSDGPFNPPGQVPAGTRVDGSCTASSPCTVTVPLRDAPNHVFNFTTVTIGQFVTVKFQRNAANTPVFILAQGDVTINGTIDLRGQDASGGIIAAPAGPGGLNGGLGAAPGSPPPRYGGAGVGPGGGGGGRDGASQGSTFGGGGGFATRGGEGEAGAGGIVYGTPELLPLIGGSGGGSGGTNENFPGGNGGGGGGALLIASSTVIDLGASGANAIIARGGNGEGRGSSFNGGGGSGGAIRLVATTLRGSRNLSAEGGNGGSGFGIHGSVGRIRLESVRFQYTGGASPQYTFGPPGPIFPPVTPAVRIVSVAGIAAPGQPTADITTPDVTLPANFTNPVSIVLEATNVPSGTMARVLTLPQLGGGARVIAGPVALTGPLGQPKRATVNVTLPARGLGIISAVIDSAIAEP